jgi:hypothetical protein
MMPQVLTANRLQPGEVVYWNGAKGWVTALAEAEVLEDERAESTLKEVQEYVAKREVVATYLFDVRVENGAIKPVKMREIIRAAGPTVRRDLGKQAD